MIRREEIGKPLTSAYAEENKEMRTLRRTMAVTADQLKRDRHLILAADGMRNVQVVEYEASRAKRKSFKHGSGSTRVE
jgi:hypothetical protein